MRATAQAKTCGAAIFVQGTTMTRTVFIKDSSFAYNTAHYNVTLPPKPSLVIVLCSSSCLHALIQNPRSTLSCLTARSAENSPPPWRATADRRTLFVVLRRGRRSTVQATGTILMLGNLTLGSGLGRAMPRARMGVEGRCGVWQEAQGVARNAPAAAASP